MPNTFNLSQGDSAEVYARPEERKRVSVSPGSSAHLSTRDGHFKEFAETIEIDEPIVVFGPGNFAVVGIDTEPSAPAEKADHDDVQDPSRAARRANPKRKKAKK